MSKIQFSKKFSKLLKDNNMTQKSFAEYLGYSPETISKYCRGEAEPNLETLMKIAEYFNVTIDELITDKSPAKYLSPLATSIKQGGPYFFRFIKKNKFEILKKDDSGKDLIDYLMKFKMNDELINLIESTYIKNEQSFENETKEYRGTIALLEDIYEDPNYLNTNYKSIINCLIAEDYPYITDKLSIPRTELIDRIKDLNAFNEYIIPVLEEAYKITSMKMYSGFISLNKSFSSRDRSMVRKRLSESKDQIIEYFIKNNCFQYAVKAEKWISNPNKRKGEVYFQKLLVEKNAPLDVVRAFSQRASEILSEYTKKLLRTDKKLLDEYKSKAMESKYININDFDRMTKINYYLGYIFENKLNDEIKIVYEILMNSFYRNLKTRYGDYTIFPSGKLPRSLFNYLRKIQEYSEKNKEYTLWKEIMEQETSQAILNIGIEYYDDRVGSRIVKLKDLYGLKFETIIE